MHYSVAARSTLLLILTVVLSLGSTTNPNPPQSPVEEEPIELVLWGPYWSVAPGFTSNLEMKNNRAQETLTAHLSLYFASGEEYYLSSLTLGPRQAVILNLNRAIESLPASVRTRASREGTIEVKTIAPNDAAIMGAVSVRNPEGGIAWNFRLYGRNAGLPDAPVRGLFWLRNGQTEGFVALQNASEENLTVTPRFHIGSNYYDLPAVTLGPGQGNKLDIRPALRQVGQDHSRSGGIEFISVGAPDALKAHGALFDNQGFSMEMDFHSYLQWDHQQTVVFRTPRIAVGAVAPGLGLPAATKFEPFLIVHNFNGHALNTALRLGYEAGGAHQEQQVPLTFAPGESRVIALLPYLTGAVAAQQPWANLELTYEDWHRGLLAELVSVSQDGAHSMRSLMNWVHGLGGEGWNWRADATYNTLIGILNASDEASTVRVSLDYDQGGLAGSYDLPAMTIAPRASGFVDLHTILAAGQPDPDGDVIPPGTVFGGYKVRKTAGQPADSIIMESLVVDRQRKSFLTMYNTCCPYTAVAFTANPTSGFPGDSTVLIVTGKNKCSGGVEDITYLATFESLSPSVVEIPVASVGNMLSAGSATLVAHVTYPGIPFIPGEGCPTTEVDRFKTITVNPPSITLSGTTSLPLENEFPTYKTGVGIVSVMQANPTSTNWDGTQITEALTTISNSCPSNFGNQCAGSTTFTIGQSYPFHNLPATQNKFYDEHSSIYSVSLLHEAGIDTCVVECRQWYYHQGVEVGSFTVRRTFTRDTIQGTPVTRVAVTKQ